MNKHIVALFAALMLVAPAASAASLVGYGFINLSKSVSGDSGQGQWTIMSLQEIYGGPGLNRFAAQTACNNLSLAYGTTYEPVFIDSVQERDFLSDSVKSGFGEVTAWIGDAASSLGGGGFLIGGQYRVLRIKDKAITTASELSQNVVICERQ
ncbi:MAG: hypothetical protein ACI9WU_003124 [Myxococcota bacterium]|jgi:hypothetical protein